MARPSPLVTGTKREVLIVSTVQVLCRPLSLSSHNQRTANEPEGSIFLHPAYHSWLKSLGGQGSVDDVGNFPTGTLQEADIIIYADTSDLVTRGDFAPRFLDTFLFEGRISDLKLE